MVRLQDIAKNIGVSTATVSYVLSGKAKTSGIPDKTAAHIMEEAKRLGYFKNKLGVQLKSGRSRQIIFISHQFQQEYSFGIYAGLCESCQRAGYTARMVDSGTNHPIGDPEKVRDFYAKLLEERPEAAVIYYQEVLDEEFIDACRKMNIPVCVVENHDINSKADLLVYADTKGGEAEAVRYLCEYGYRKIGFCYSQNPYTVPIKTGFCGQMEEFGLPCNGQWMLKIGAGQKGYAEFFENIRALLDAGNLPEAFCCADDYTAVDLMIFFLKNGLKVPQDISVIGFGGLQFTRRFVHSVTTVSKDYYKIGACAADALLAVLSGKEQPRCTVIPCTIYEGGSVYKR